MGESGSRGREGSDGENPGDLARRRGNEVWKLILQRVALAGGTVDQWGSVTFAELDYVATQRTIAAWDRAAFIATCAFNANPFLKRYVPIKNPYRVDEDSRDYQLVDLADVPFD